MKALIIAALVYVGLGTLAWAVEGYGPVPQVVNVTLGNDPNLLVCAALIAAGIAFHFLTKLKELEDQGQIITPWAYWSRTPYTSLTVVMGAYLAGAAAHYAGELTYLASVLIGVACNSMGDKLRARAAAKG